MALLRGKFASVWVCSKGTNFQLEALQWRSKLNEIRHPVVFSLKHGDFYAFSEPRLRGLSCGYITIKNYKERKSSYFFQPPMLPLSFISVHSWCRASLMCQTICLRYNMLVLQVRTFVTIRIVLDPFHSATLFSFPLLSFVPVPAWCIYWYL